MRRKIIALVCALSLMAPCALAAGESYRDVPAGAWYAPAAEEMTEKGIMTGVGEGVFAPLDPVSRAAAVTVLWRMEGSPDAAGAAFADTENTWYEQSAAWGGSTGIVSGYGDDTFRGDQPVTREELSAFLYRYAKMKGEPVAQGVLRLYSDADKISPWAKRPWPTSWVRGFSRGPAGSWIPRERPTGRLWPSCSSGCLPPPWDKKKYVRFGNVL